MNDDYLWDGSGTPDPFVVRLERKLAPLCLRTHAPWAAAAPAPTRRRLWPWALAVGLTCAAAAGVVLAQTPPAPQPRSVVSSTMPMQTTASGGVAGHGGAGGYGGS